MFGDQYSGIVGFFGIVRALEGRTKLQKSIYLAKEHGFPGLWERFDFHRFGPYSETLANEVQELVQLGILTERKVSDTHPMYAYELNESAFQYFEEYIAAARQYRELASYIVKEDVRSLELAATLLYFTRNGYSRVQAEREVTRVKAERQFTQVEMDRAWSFLDGLQDAATRLSSN